MFVVGSRGSQTTRSTRISTTAGRRSKSVAVLVPPCLHAYAQTYARDRFNRIARNYDFFARPHSSCPKEFPSRRYRDGPIDFCNRPNHRCVFNFNSCRIIAIFHDQRIFRSAQFLPRGNSKNTAGTIGQALTAKRRDDIFLSFRFADAAPRRPAPARASPRRPARRL